MDIALEIRGNNGSYTTNHSFWGVATESRPLLVHGNSRFLPADAGHGMTFLFLIMLWEGSALMEYRDILFAIAIILIDFAVARNARAQSSPKTCYFAVSGDSRNCGDVVIPAIAADPLKHNVAFYWRLGGLGAIYRPDQDFV